MRTNVFNLSLILLPNENILTYSEFNALVDDNFNLGPRKEFVSDRLENIAGKGENAGYQHFLLFPLCFQKPSVLKFGIGCQRGKAYSPEFRRTIARQHFERLGETKKLLVTPTSFFCSYNISEPIKENIQH